MGKFIDRTGHVFGRLTVLHRVESRKRSGAVWLCQCECGNKCEVLAYNLANGNSTSCGCATREQSTKHGFCRSENKEERCTYHVWEALKQRVTKSNCKAYKNYGGRGITIDPRWYDFKNFLDDMGVRPPGTSLDRINNNGNYEPGNCRWATRIEQNSNKRNNLFVCYNKEKITISELSRVTGISLNCLYYRIVVKKLTVEDALIYQVAKRTKKPPLSSVAVDHAEGV